MAAAGAAVGSAVVVMLVVVVMVVMVVMVVVVMMTAGDVIVVNMHGIYLLGEFFYIIISPGANVKAFIFFRDPPGKVAPGEKRCYNASERGGRAMSENHAHGHVHENQKAVVNRLARAIGHLNKVKRMVEEGYDCADVLVQLAAVRSAIDNTGKVILNDHIRHCMVDAVQLGDESAIDDLCDAVEKFMK